MVSSSLSWCFSASHGRRVYTGWLKDQLVETQNSSQNMVILIFCSLVTSAMRFMVMAISLWLKGANVDCWSPANNRPGSHNTVKPAPWLPLHLGVSLHKAFESEFMKYDNIVAMRREMRESKGGKSHLHCIRMQQSDTPGSREKHGSRVAALPSGPSLSEATGCYSIIKLLCLCVSNGGHCLRRLRPYTCDRSNSREVELTEGFHRAEYLAQLLSIITSLTWGDFP